MVCKPSSFFTSARIKINKHFLYYTDFLPVFVCIASRILKPSKKLLICSINCFPKRLCGETGYLRNAG